VSVKSLGLMSWTGFLGMAVFDRMCPVTALALMTPEHGSASLILKGLLMLSCPVPSYMGRSLEQDVVYVQMKELQGWKISWRFGKFDPVVNWSIILPSQNSSQKQRCTASTS
jgi:hypothetical protein